MIKAGDADRQAEAPPPAARKRRRKRGFWLIAATVALAGLTALSIALQFPLSSERLRRKVVAFLSDRLDSAVDLRTLTLKLLPRPHVEAENLAIYLNGRRDIPPLISMEGIEVGADFVGLWRKHVGRLDVSGLRIQIAPKDKRPDSPDYSGSPAGRDWVVDEFVANNSSLTIYPRDASKPPRVWNMHELQLQRVGINQTMPFRSVLTNAVPPGEIETTGNFGPWNVEEPVDTPLNGDFTFENADLSVFKGISGTLAAKGQYGGALERIDVHGDTTTPDFTVTVAGHPVPLEARYHAIVDGTSGDTTLERIDAKFLQTVIAAKGGVLHVEGVKGRVVTLDVMMKPARLEDVMKLAIKAKTSPMTGALSVQTKLEIPPGDRDVVQKLKLNGNFAINDGLFTDPDIQKKIVELSRRGKGQTGDDKPTTQVASDFTGRFVLGNGVLSLPSVTFAVPGAAVELTGRYSLTAETIDFKGNLYLDAKISQTMTGWKSWLLKIVDPLFRKNGRTLIPIKIQGTRTQPSFGLDTGRVFSRSDPLEQKKPAAAAPR